MADLTWLPYLIAALIIAVACYLTFGRARSDANRGGRRVDPPG